MLVSLRRARFALACGSAVLISFAHTYGSLAGQQPPARPGGGRLRLVDTCPGVVAEHVPF
jgi:hypothetical protein